MLVSITSATLFHLPDVYVITVRPRFLRGSQNIQETALLSRRPSPAPMPPWVASVPQLPGALRRRAIDGLPSRPNAYNVVNRTSSLLRPRYLSAKVSPTAINVRPNVPPQNKELYDALSELSKVAESYVNISRLQLALRGVAAHEPVLRLAGMFPIRRRGLESADFVFGIQFFLWQVKEMHRGLPDYFLRIHWAK